MFADVEADAYVMVDGDHTYDAQVAPQLVQRLFDDGLDMLVGSRVSEEQAAYRFGHRFGNALLTGVVTALFGRSFTDILSGYRVFSRRYVKSFAAHSTGFEIETELTVHALELRMPVAEVATRYGARPEGSFSKLNTYRDGWRILGTIARLFKSEKPLAFYTLAASACALLSLVLAWPAGADLSADRAGATPAHGRAVLRPHAVRRDAGRVRHRARCRDQGAHRAEALCLSGRCAGGPMRSSLQQLLRLPSTVCWAVRPMWPCCTWPCWPAPISIRAGCCLFCPPCG
jgi:hypothetical protein